MGSMVGLLILPTRICRRASCSSGLLTFKRCRSIRNVGELIEVHRRVFGPICLHHRPDQFRKALEKQALHALLVVPCSTVVRICPQFLSVCGGSHTFRLLVRSDSLVSGGKLLARGVGLQQVDNHCTIRCEHTLPALQLDFLRRCIGCLPPPLEVI